MMRRRQRSPFCTSHRAGFTLLEMLIVIGVILVLTAITVTVLVGLQARSDIRQTENTLRLLDMALSEWEASTSRQVTFGINGPPSEPCGGEVYEIDQIYGAGFSGWATEADAFEDAELLTDRLWAILSTSTTALEIIARVDPAFVEQAEVAMAAGGDPRPTFHFTDSWDREILAILPGRKFSTNCNDPYIQDNDGSIRTAYENRFGVAANRRIFFVSAGPDGKFGDLSDDPTRIEYRQATDNVYSYEVILP
jgi:prepilin-type N-terminal cleavage/methylation domain-containing protein